MVLEKKSDAEPIAGYRLISRLGHGGFGEVWKCEAPGGIFKAIKFVYGDLNGLDVDSARAEEELRAVQHIKSIRHPFLLSIDRVESINGELVIVTELADQNLDELLAQYRGQGWPGIPRAELFGYLREAAEVLDVMNLRYHLQHLDVKPRNLFLVSQHVKVADFGLVNSVSGQGNVHLGAITPLYASPEVFQGKISQHSDQYSLAIAFQELLTGTLPFQGKNARQLLLQHTQAEPDLQALPQEDRAIVARALAKDPAQRFPSCLDFLRALQAENALVHLFSSSVAQEPALPAVPAPGGETVSNMAQDTEKYRTRTEPPVPADVLPNFRFLECLGNSPLVDMWKVQTPDGRSRLLKILYGFSFPDAKRVQEVVQRLRSLQHPCLVETEIVHTEPGRLFVVTDLVQETLRDRFSQCQARKMPGIMRGELVDYLRAAAEVLDYLYQQHSVQHLSLNPRNLVLNNDWLQINEFGLAQLLWLPAGQAVAQRNARYAPPELFDKVASRSVDQYSLAIIYAEMLTGVHPFRSGSGYHSPKQARFRGQPDLERLPEQDRSIIARALDPDPTKRWPSCTAMVLALEGTNEEVLEQLQEKQDHFDAFLKAPRPKHAPVPPEAVPEDLNKIIADIIGHAAGSRPASEPDLPVFEEAGDVVHHKFLVGLPLGSARMKLENFCQQWYGEFKGDDERGCLIHINMPSNFWQQWIGRQSGLEILVKLARVQPMSPTPIEVRVQIRAFRCNKKRASILLEGMAPPLLESLRKILLVNSEKRTQDRILWPHALKVIPMHPSGSREEPIECRGKDISFSGIGFYLPHELDTSDVLIELPNSIHPPVLSVPATLVRARPTTDGWYEVGALFRLPALRKSKPELCLAEGS